MRLRALDNGGLVIVNPSFGQRLIAGGGWEEVVDEKPEPKTKTPTRRNRRTAPAEEPVSEE